VAEKVCCVYMMESASHVLRLNSRLNRGECYFKIIKRYFPAHLEGDIVSNVTKRGH